MSDFITFTNLPLDLLLGKHNFGSDEFRVALVNVEPDRDVDLFYGDLSEIVAQNGYLAGGNIVTVYTLLDQGVTYVNADDVEFTADANPTGFGPFQWGVVYNNTTAEKNLVGYTELAGQIIVASGAMYKFSFGTATGMFRVVLPEEV